MFLPPVLFGRAWAPALRVAAMLRIVPAGLLIALPHQSQAMAVVFGGLYGGALLLVLAVLLSREVCA